jgi:trehalose 6-phosphate phosphatase
MTALPPPPPLDTDRHALFLDFDGTLVDFAPKPDLIALRPGTIALLENLNRRLASALAVVTGRRIADLDRYLSPLVLSASGVHGQELRLIPGETEWVPPPAEMEEARRRLKHAIEPGDPLLLEDKGSALVLHFRKHPDQRERAAALAREAVTGLRPLHVVPGRGVYEINERSVTKARAIYIFAARPPFLDRVAVAIGDDETDENAIEAAQAIGGFGVKVGPGRTHARYRLPDIDAVHRWLSGLRADPGSGTSALSGSL